MPKRVLDVGNCAMDYGSIKHLIESNFDAQVEQVHDADSARSRLAAAAFDLVLVNRIFDQDGDRGLQLIQQIRSDESRRNVPVMLITNFPEFQEDAAHHGAVPGFGKNALGDSATLDKLRRYLD